MFAKILSSSQTFNGVDYNERKVSQGVAQLIEIKNFSYLQILNLTGREDLKDYLKSYSSRNTRISNTQFHVTISCKGKEYSHDELKEIGHKYMEKMGYAEEGQPMLIYGHFDTENNHIHIITSRVNPKGQKINDSHEKIRSQAVIEEIMGIDWEDRLGTVLKKTLSYNFESVNQFMSIFEASGYECYEKDLDICIKRGGFVQKKIRTEQIKKRISKNYLDDNRRKQLTAILYKYRDMVSGKAELKDIMKNNFGVDLIFLGSKDTPYGYMIVDHKNKSVYKGSEILSLKTLLQFQDKEERLKRIDMYIDGLLDDNPKLTTKEVNRMVRRQFGTYITKGKIVMGNDKFRLKYYMLEALSRNDKYAWLQDFCPSTEVEKELICKFGNVSNNDFISISDEKKNVEESVSFIKECLNNTEEDHISFLRDCGVFVFNRKDEIYCIDIANKCIINAKEHGLNIQTKPEKQQYKGKNKGIGIKNSLPGINEGKASDTNREWEVGNYPERNNDGMKI